MKIVKKQITKVIRYQRSWKPWEMDRSIERGYDVIWSSIAVQMINHIRYKLNED